MKVIITGSTGMVGKGVLVQCLEDNRIKKILLVNRTSIKLNNTKIKEIICDNFLNLANHEKDFKGYDACFHCMGISVVGSTDEYYKTTTYDITKIITDLVFKGNKNAVFNYVTGEGTDSSEKGPIRWARIKGKTENYILQKGFKDSYMFRAGIIIPEKGIKFITTTSKLGNAMINTLFFNHKKKIINNIHINKISFLS